MQPIGTIKQVQIQRDRLKQGQRPHAHYDPAPILVVEQLRLTPEGIFGLTAEGEAIIDVHHAQHPNTRYREVNGISIGFTHHYQQMQARFGGHVTEGCGGENIIVAVEAHITAEMLGETLAIRTQTGEKIPLTGVMVAAPCVEFSQFVALTPDPLPPEMMRDTLQYLDGGRRGFYATLSPTLTEAIVQPGDTLIKP